LKSRGAFGVLLAGSKLAWAFFLNALLRISQGNLNDKLLRNHCQTVVLLSTLGNIDGGLASFSGKAKSPARDLGSTFVLAILKSGDAFGVFLAGSPFIRTFFLNALLGISQGNSSRSLFLGSSKAVVVQNAFVEIRSRLVSLFGETSSPACSVVGALLFTVLKGGEAFVIFLASLELAGAFLSNAILRSKDGI
jgi:hypothetical protein